MPGVYAVFGGQAEVLYVGRARDSLSRRWSPQGYAVIHARNCYRRGQSTNCRINFLIGNELGARRPLELWSLLDKDPGADRETDHPPAAATLEPSVLGLLGDRLLDEFMKALGPALVVVDDERSLVGLVDEAHRLHRADRCLHVRQCDIAHGEFVVGMLSTHVWPLVPGCAQRISDW